MNLDTKHLDSIPTVDENQARVRLFHHLADVAYEKGEEVVRQGLYVVGKEGANPQDRLFYYQQLEELGQGIKETFGSIPLEKIKRYVPMVRKE